jgi:hypothetical protein
MTSLKEKLIHEERVEEFAHLCVFPDEGPLQVGQGDHFTLDVAHQRSNGALTVLEDRRLPANPWFPDGGESAIRKCFEQILQRFGSNMYRSSERMIERYDHKERHKYHGRQDPDH